ncbi:MAG: lysylphosphatidylglycerol synthase domain-containing protein [Bacteroidota bacterium]
MKWELLKKIVKQYQVQLKLVISLLLMAALIRVFVVKVGELKDLDWTQVVESLYLLPFLLILVIVNWSVEALKWQLVTISNGFWQSVKVVLVGLLFKQFIPLGLGELSGRMLADHHTDKKEVAGAFLLVGFTQFAVTVFLGCFGVGWLLFHTNYAIGQVPLVGLAVAVAIVFVIYLLKNQILMAYHKWFNALGEISSAKVRQLIMLALLRYLVFFSQSLVVFAAFNQSVQVLLLAAGISFVFLVKTIIPNIGFAGDLGVRGFSAVLFFQYFGIGAMPVILAGLCVWVINIFLPSFVALFFIRQVRMYKEKE